MTDTENDTMNMNETNNEASSETGQNTPSAGISNTSNTAAHASAYVAADPGARLRSIIERVERLEEEKKNIADDIRDIYLEAKSEGYNVKVLRKLVSLRKKNPDDRREEEDLLSLYMSSIGMA